MIPQLMGDLRRLGRRDPTKKPIRPAKKSRYNIPFRYRDDWNAYRRAYRICQFYDMDWPDVLKYSNGLDPLNTDGAPTVWQRIKPGATA